MKNLFISFLLLLLPMMAMGQLLYEKDFTGITEFTGWYQFDDSQTDGKVEVDPDGIAITVGIQIGQFWQPQVMVVPDRSFNLKEDDDYLVVVTAKFPTDGTLQINMGSWSANDQAQFPVTATGDFQEVVCEFPKWSVDAEGAHLLFDCGDFKGTTILKKIAILNLTNVEEKWTIAGDEGLMGANWDVTKNKMLTTDMEIYTLTRNDIKLSKGTYNYKVYKDFATDESYPSSNASLEINEEGVYSVKFTFNTKTKELSATAKKKVVWTIAGDESLTGANWDITIDKNKMSTSDGESYKLSKANLLLAKGTYEFKVYKDYSTQESYPSNNAALVIEEDAIYTVNFTFNANTKEVYATATKTDGIFFNYISKGKVAELIQNPNKYKGDISIPSTVTHEGEKYIVTKISDNAFSGCSGLTSITIPNSVTSIGSYAFTLCTGLTSVTIGNSVTSIGNYAFNGCSGLNSISIPNSVTSIGGSAFNNCSRLKSIIIPNSVTSIGWNAFYGCTGLTSITISNSVMIIDVNAFSDCTGLTSITIPNGVKSIGVSAFAGCTGLTSITISNSVTSIGSSAFYGCSGLTSVTIPNSVTSIGSSAFYGCSGLTSVTIPNSVTRIENQAFANCNDLTDVYCMAEEISSTNNYGTGSLYTAPSAFEDSYIEYATLHVPSSAINAYKTTAPWSGFKEFVIISGETISKCATPTIIIENGKIKFNCETEGVEFVSEITTTDAQKYYDGEITPTYKYKISVYATKDGYENSNTATAEYTATGLFGDLTGDGKVDVADHVKLSGIIMNQIITR